MEAVCRTCMHHCKLKPGEWGICRARKNEAGAVVCKNYGQVTSLALDPVEKKPLSLFYPGSAVLSVGSFGCNLRCPFCQNHEISMAGFEEADARFLAPQELVKMAIGLCGRGNIGVAFTYNEPLVGWEYVLDASKLLKENGMKSVVVTNGTLDLEILAHLLPFVDAMNIDLKGFRQEYYQKLGGNLQAVLDFITLAQKSCHVELTTLIVPGENDAASEMEEEAKWIASLDKGIPLHVTRFFPRYRMQGKAATDVRRVHRLAQVAERHLEHVFVGNC